MARLTIWLRRVDAQIRFRASEITRLNHHYSGRSA
jgi:hypothetical protein